MAKKRFTEGMESLFSNAGSDDPRKRKLTLFSGETQGEENPDDTDSRRSSNKGFAASLDAFLAEAFESADREAEEEAEGGTSAPVAAAKRPRGRRPGSGLDLLIRQTSGPSEFVPQQHDTRRVTLIFNKQHLEKLKTIARRKNLYLKDVIDEIVSSYLQRQESEKE